VSGRIPPGAHARAGRLAVALLLAVAGLLPAMAGPVAAADVTFGTPKADVEYTQGITFSVPVTVGTPLQRVEIRLRYPGALGPFIEEVPAPGSGSQTLTYRLDTTGGGHLVPNTPIEVTWAALPEGATEPVLSRTTTVRYDDTSQDWKTLKGDLVVVHWSQGDESFARRALEIGDKAVKDTADLLGVTETEPVDFFIYGDPSAFRTALGPGTRENVGGQAHADIRTLFALITPGEIGSPWVSIVVPHELVHLVFDTAVDNPYRFPPRWVNEGLAVYLSEGYGPGDRNQVADAVGNGDLLPLTALTGQFPTEPSKTSLAYAESVSAIDHLVRISDQDTLLTLITSYKDGLTDDQAFTRALGMDVATFQAGWLDQLGASAPVPYGPVANPPGPVPPGWDAPAAGQPTAAPGESASAPSARPLATPVPDSPGVESGRGSADIPLVLLAILAVVAAVVAGMAVARRRADPR
jgi:hypothetical protein